MTTPFDPAARERLSVCMIVRNEEAMLARCLKAVRPYAGEIIVVDTGSTDRTVEIARENGAIVQTFTWCDDFAAARNASLDAATKPWALVVDADEEFSCDDPSVLARVVLGEGTGGHSILVRNLQDDGRSTQSRVFRLFRRDQTGMRYRGVIHEQVAAVADGQVTMGPLLPGVELLHHGYLGQVIESQGKAERNRRLSEKLIETRPEDPFAWYCRGISIADPQARVDCFEKALAALPVDDRRSREPWVAMLYLRLLEGLSQLQRWDDVASHAAKARAVFPSHPEFPLMVARVRTVHGKGDDVIEPLLSVLELVGRGSTLEWNPASLEVEARSLMALSLMTEHRWAEAENQLEAAIAKAGPSDVLPHRAMGFLCLRTGRLADARAHLEKILSHASEDPSIIEALTDVLVMTSAWSEALDLLGQLEQTPDTQARIERTVEAMLQAEQPEKSLEILTHWYELDMTHPDACYWLGAVAEAIQEKDLARSLWERAVQNRPGFDRARLALERMAASVA